MCNPFSVGRRWAVWRCVVLVCAGTAVTAFSALPRPPNVVFLFSDDQRFDTIHALGNREIETPHLDRLVHDGFAFTQAHIMGAMQGAVCVPSRAMVMTGRSLFRATVKTASDIIPPRLPFWPVVMREAGYTSIGVGKWHNDRASYTRGFDAGGPIFFGGMSEHRRVPVFDFDPAGQYPPNLQHTSAVFSTTLFADAAIQFLHEKREKPFFLYVAFTAPHDPRTPPEEFAKKYLPEKMPLPKNFLPEHPFDNGELKGRDERLLPWPRTPEAVRKEIAAYYGMISHLDAQVGRILRALEEVDEAGRTIIIFAGDNGLALGQHGLLGKQNLYDHSVRVPLVFQGPGIPKGKKSAALVYLFDVFPTLCELAGLEIPRGVEGQSLWPLMQGKEKHGREAVFGAYRDLQRMACDGRWKLILYPLANRTQLFDLAKDPEEMNDLAAQAKYADKVAEMRAKLLRLQQQFGDPLVQSPVQSVRAVPDKYFAL